ncbi:MAG TPA: site-specific integrase, partial [Solirubrobacteraceae bacterium]|nr:site-specific integrase [Solirubrobacteraceae bacterium]
GEHYKPGTLRTYGYSVRDVLKPKLGHLRLHEVRRRDVQRIADELRAEGASASRVRTALDPLRVLYRRAMRDELVRDNPTTYLDLPAVRPREPRVVNPAQAARLLDALPAEDRALWATAFYAGLRRGELRALRWDDIDLDAAELRVRRSWDDVAGEQTPKSAAGSRDVPIVPQLARLLREHRMRTGRRGEALVFGRTDAEPFGRESVRRRADTAWREAKLERVGLHDARHTFTSYLPAAGVTIKQAQTYAGHSDSRMTLDVYARAIPGMLAADAVRLGEYLEAQGA